jgi:hypothetical protein
MAIGDMVRGTRGKSKNPAILPGIYFGILLMSTNSFAVTCAPPRHYQYALSNQVALPCRGPNLNIRVPVMTVNVPDRGRAIARANLTYLNPDSSVYYFWNGIVVVGGTSVGLSHGTDICPKTSSSGAAILGYGDLNSNNQSTVSVMVQEGAAACVDGVVTAASGTLDVWVEDPNPACVGRDIRFISSANVYGEDNIYFWSDSMTELLHLPVSASSNRSEILIMGAVEGTPISGSTPYSCSSGSPNFNLAAQLMSTDQGVVSTLKSAIPPFSGMGHLVLSLFAQAPYGSQTTSVSMWVRSDIDPLVTTNGCGFSVPCGDAKLGFVKIGGKSRVGQHARNSSTPCERAYNTILKGFAGGVLTIQQDGDGKISGRMAFPNFPDSSVIGSCMDSSIHFIALEYNQSYSGTINGDGSIAGAIADNNDGKTYIWSASPVSSAPPTASGIVPRQ